MGLRLQEQLHELAQSQPSTKAITTVFWLALGEKGAGPASSVLVPRLTCPATLVQTASTCRRKASIALVGGAGDATSPIAASWQLCCPVEAHPPQMGEQLPELLHYAGYEGPCLSSLVFGFRSLGAASASRALVEGNASLYQRSQELGKDLCLERLKVEAPEHELQRLRLQASETNHLLEINEN
ncbi:hypothetical protein LIER_16784 [Lithospermum erythrorhizon]|uniref:Uncharacterized protein n=1 Tax=Lithospermum erythrorhizon TaxID=34254 RepID=A0AAV3QAF4_LITER